MGKNVFYIIFILSQIALFADENLYVYQLEIMPDINDQGIVIINKTVRFDSPIEILNSGWVDLYGDNQYTEYFAVYSQYNGEAIGTLMSSLRQNNETFKPKCFYLSFPMKKLNIGDLIIELDLNKDEEYGFDFFQYNNKRYVIKYNKMYKWFDNITDYFGFEIYEFIPSSGVISTIYRNEDNSYERYEIIDGNIVFYNGKNQYILLIENENVQFIMSN
jgi:hypothetical protein